MENKNAQEKQVPLRKRGKRQRLLFPALGVIAAIALGLTAWFAISRGWIFPARGTAVLQKGKIPSRSRIADWLAGIDTRTVSTADMAKIADIPAGTGSRGVRLAAASGRPSLLLTEKQGLFLLDKTSPPVRVDDSHLKEALRPRELVDIAYNERYGRYYAVDKMNSIFSVDPGVNRMELEKAFETDAKSQDSQYAAMASSGDRLFLLDPTLNTIWAYDIADHQISRWAPLAKNPVSWRMRAGDLDLTGQIGIAADSVVYLLNRFGEILELGVRGKTKKKMVRRSRFLPIWESARPSLCERRIHIGGPEQDWLITVDNATGRLIFSDLKRRAADLNPDHQIVFLQDSKPLWIQDVTADDHLLLLTPEAVYRFPQAETLSEYFARNDAPGAHRNALKSLAGAIRKTPETESPWLEKSLLKLGLRFPLEGIYLPEYIGVYPGALRGYRFGVHQGIDLYDPRNTELASYRRKIIASAAAGNVTYVSRYSRLAKSEYDRLIEECRASRTTSAKTLELLNGNSIVLMHQQTPYRLETRYSHLANIAEDIRPGVPVKAGEILGLMGNSGTSDEIKRTRTGIHLHFEIVIDGQYLGSGLSHYQTMILYQRLFRRNSQFATLPEPVFDD